MTKSSFSYSSPRIFILHSVASDDVLVNSDIDRDSDLEDMDEDDYEWEL